MRHRTRIMIIAGTRPEGIKMAPLWCQLRDMPESFDPPIFCSTGQHEAMLDSVLDLFGVTVDHRLHLLQARAALLDPGGRSRAAGSGNGELGHRKRSLHGFCAFIEQPF